MDNIIIIVYDIKLCCCVALVDYQVKHGTALKNYIFFIKFVKKQQNRKMPRHKKTKRIQGKVKWFDPTKGIGFITTQDGLNVFVHYSQLPIRDGRFVPLKENEEVSFELQQGFNGLQAVNIQVLTQKFAK